MFQIPSIPPIEGLHPVVVHFTIGLLLSAWVPMLLGSVDVKRRHGWFLSGLMMLILGTLFSFASVFTGEAAERVTVATSEVVEQAIHEHAELAEFSRLLFVGVLVIYTSAMILYSKVAESKKKRMGIIGAVLVVSSYAISSLALANAGHQGGLLVHVHGIHAPVAPADMPSNTRIDDR